DFLNNGRTKVFANYGRYFESIPLGINDRQFSGEGIVTQNITPDQLRVRLPGEAPADNTCLAVNGRIDPSTCQFPRPTRDVLNGGTIGKVSPTLQGQYTNEVVAGLQYDVGLDVVLGATYIHRDLGRIIEDISPDGGRNYIIANPGADVDSGSVDRLRSDV